MNEAALQPEPARHILQRVGESGQPPEQGITHLNVGNDSYLRILDREYLQRLKRNPRGSGFKLVQGYYGGGKTHFLYCVRDLAWKHGFLTSLVNLSPRECPYDDPVKVYSAVAVNLTSPPLDNGMEPTRGLTDVLRDLMDDKLAVMGEERAMAWLRQTAGRVAAESHSFRKAAATFMEAHLKGDAGRETVLEPWLLGEPVPQTDTRPLGVFEAVDSSTGFKMLRSLSQIISGYGLPGITLLFDEVDRNLSLTSRKMLAVGDNLRQVIDLCGQARLPSTLFIYAVPPEFMRNVVPDYPALDQRLKSPVPLSERSPQAAVIDLEHLDMEPEVFLEAIGERLLTIFETAVGWKADAAIQAHNRSLIAGTMAAYSFEVSHRRLFVKTYVDFLYGQKSEIERRITEEEAVRIVQGGYAVLESVEYDDEEFLDA
ncbi:MAG: BREX system ATP-binding domain-containing protein [Thermodesulfobacteriota bacterium]